MVSNGDLLHHRPRMEARLHLTKPPAVSAPLRSGRLLIGRPRVNHFICLFSILSSDLPPTSTCEPYNSWAARGGRRYSSTAIMVCNIQALSSGRDHERKAPRHSTSFDRYMPYHILDHGIACISIQTQALFHGLKVQAATIGRVMELE